MVEVLIVRSGSRSWVGCGVRGSILFGGCEEGVWGVVGRW